MPECFVGCSKKWKNVGRRRMVGLLEEKEKRFFGFPFSGGCDIISNNM